MIFKDIISPLFPKEVINTCKCGSDNIKNYRNRVGWYRIYCDDCANNFNNPEDDKDVVLFKWNKKNPITTTHR